MGETIVYADLSFIINYLIDASILWASARLCGARINWRRILGISFIGALYGILILFPACSFLYSFPIKVVFSMLLVYFGHGSRSIREFFKGMVGFYLLSFTAVGATLGLEQYMASAEPGNNWKYLMFSIVMLIILAWYIEKSWAQKLITSKLKYNVTIKISGSDCTGQGFLDTGNSLRDPLTGKAVLVAEHESIIDCLPVELKSLIVDREITAEQILAIVEGSNLGNRLRIIPFSSVGNEGGFMLGVRADEVIIQPQGSKINEYKVNKNIVVALCMQKLSKDNSFSMLVPMALI